MRRTPLSLFFFLCLLRAVAQYPQLDRLELAFAQGAADSVMDQLGGLLKDPHSSADLRFEACMLIAECYYQRSSMERFAAWNDSAAAIIASEDNELWARVEVNRCRYANFYIKSAQAMHWGATALARYRLAPDRAAWKYAYQIYQALGTAYRNRPVEAHVVFAHFDTAQALLARRPYTLPYWQAHLHKAISNAAMDRMRPGAPQRELYVEVCDREQRAALRILEKYYPKQVLDRCTMQNLRGLFQTYRDQPDSALWWLQRTEHMINAYDPSRHNDASMSVWFTCLRWRSFVMCQQPWASDIRSQQDHLAKLRTAQEHFSEYVADRASASGLFFQDNYWFSPFASIVSTCARLWALTGDTTYVEQALWATEKSRRDAWNMAQSLRGTIGRKLDDPPTDMVNAIRGRLTSHEAVLLCAHNSLASIRNELVVLLITPSEVALRVTETKLHPYSAGVMESRDPLSYRRMYHELYKEIYAPVEPMLRDIAQVHVVPSGDAVTIAFDALLADTTSQDVRACSPLVQRHAFSYPLLLLPPNQPAAPLSGAVALYIAPTPGKGPLTDLTRMREALRKWAAHDFIDSLFDKGRLNKDFEQAHEIYLGGHCSGNRSLDAQPRHFFGADTTPRSSWIEPSDLLDLNLRADLVVHLACQSGLFDVDNNGGAVSFSRAFLLAGAHSVLSTQYLADEASTIKLVHLFRDEIASGYPKDVALQRAKLSYLAQCRTLEEALPIHWAGWQILGETGPMVTKKSTLCTWLLAAIVLGIGAIGLYVRYR